MKKYIMILYFLIGTSYFFLAGCEKTETDVIIPDISESIEFSEQEDNEEKNNSDDTDDTETKDPEEEKDTHGISEEDGEPAPFLDDFEEDEREENNEENDEEDSNISHASATSPRKLSHTERIEMIENKMKENGATELHIFDTVRLIFEEEILTGFCNESWDCTFDIKLGTNDFSIEEGNVLVIWDLSKKYYFQKEVLLVLKGEEDEGIFHITAKEGDQTHVFYDSSFSSKGNVLTTEEAMLMTTEQIDSIENKREILTEDEKEMISFLQNTLDRQKQQYEREQQEKEEKSDSSLEAQENEETTSQQVLPQNEEEKNRATEVQDDQEDQEPKKEESTETQETDQKIIQTFQRVNQETNEIIPSTTPPSEFSSTEISKTTNKPTGKEKLYKVCGTFSFGKMYSYYLCEIEDVDKQKEVFSKKLWDLAKLEDFSDFFYIKADIQGDELLYRTIIDRFTEKDLGQLTQEEFDQTFDFVNNHYHHTVSYKDEIRLSKLKEGETYTFRFDPQNGDTAKPKINNDTSNNVLVFTYSEGNLWGYEINLYPSYTFPDIPHYAFSSEDEKKYYLTFKTISSENFVKYAKTENIAFLSQEKLNTELERDKSYFYNNTNQTFTLFVKNSPYTNMPGTEGTKKEIKAWQIFGGPHAINTFTIITNDGNKNPLETTKVTSTEKKIAENPEKTPTTAPTVPSNNTTIPQTKATSSDPSSKYPLTKVLKPWEIYKDNFLGVQIKNKSPQYQGFLEIIKDTEGDDMLNTSEKYLIYLYHFAPETYKNFELINPEEYKNLASQKGYPQDFLIPFQNLCFSRRTCFNPWTMFAWGEIVLNRKGFNMEEFWGRQDDFYSDRYQNPEDYEKKLHQLESQFTFAIKSDIASTQETKTENPTKPSVSPTPTQRPQTWVQTISAEVIKKEIKSDPTFYTKNLGLYPSQGLQVDANGNLTDPQQTKEIMQKLGFCGEETAFACAQGVKRFEKEKVGKLFIYSVGTWSRENNCKGKGNATCYTPEGTTPFFTTKPSTKEGFVYLYPAKEVKLCILEGNAPTC